jgi:hypothetical protein
MVSDGAPAFAAGARYRNRTEPSMFDALALRREGVPTQAMTKAIRSGTGAR